MNRKIRAFTLNNQEISEEICNFLRKEFQERQKSKAILAVSGGIDSAVCAFLCKKAGLDLYVAILPYGERGNEGKKLAESLNLPKDHIVTLDIASLTDNLTEKISKVVKIDEVDKGNIMARQRMIIQYSLARSLNGLVVGTENLSEYYLGYFTLYGDQACDIRPIGDLFKTQVYELANHLGVPEWILSKKPSADLWEGQTDEEELGFNYIQADPILYLSCIKKYPEEKIINEFNFDTDLVKKVLKRVKTTEFKRQDPPKLNLIK